MRRGEERRWTQWRWAGEEEAVMGVGGGERRGGEGEGGGERRRWGVGKEGGWEEEEGGGGGEVVRGEGERCGRSPLEEGGRGEGEGRGGGTGRGGGWGVERTLDKQQSRPR